MIFSTKEFVINIKVTIEVTELKSCVNGHMILFIILVPQYFVYISIGIMHGILSEVSTISQKT